MRLTNFQDIKCLPTKRGSGCIHTESLSPAASSLGKLVGSHGNTAPCGAGQGLAAEKPSHTDSAHC